jgi:hypothetical protein
MSLRNISGILKKISSFKFSGIFTIVGKFQILVIFVKISGISKILIKYLEFFEVFGDAGIFQGQS